MELTFMTSEILEKLRTNREEHLKIVTEAQTGCRAKWKGMLEKALYALEAGDKVEPMLHLASPDNHVGDFDRAIEMLEMTTDEEIELDEATFQAYVRNQWSWERQFLMSNVAYSGTAQALSSEKGY